MDPLQLLVEISLTPESKLLVSALGREPIQKHRACQRQKSAEILGTPNSLLNA